MKSDGSESVSGDHELVPAEPDQLDLESTKNFKPVGQKSTMVCIVASGPRCPGFNSQCSRNYSEEKLSILLRLMNGAVWRKVDSGLKIVDQTHIALASGKLVA